MRSLLSTLLIGSAAAHNPHDVISGMITSSDGEALLAISRGQMFRSHDSGMSWSLSHEGLPNPLNAQRPNPIVSPGFEQSGATVFMLDPDAANVYKSTDSGVTWTNTTRPFGREDELDLVVLRSKSTLAARLALSPNFDEDGVIFAAGANLYRSNDGGNKWEKVLEPNGSEKGMRSVLATDAHGYYASTDNGNVYRSTDKGKTWASFGKHGTTGITNIVKSDNGVIVASKSGISELVVDVTAAPKPLLPQQKVSAADGFSGEVQVARLDSGKILATSNYELLSTSGAGWKVVGSEEGLHTAVMQSDAEGVPSFYWIQVAQKAKRVYVGGYTGIFRSDDEGDTWTKVDTLLPFIFSITAGAPRTKGATHSVSVSTYGAGVFQTEVAIKRGKATLISDPKNDRVIMGEMTRLAIQKQGMKSTEIASRYVLLEYSPNFAKDGILIVNSQLMGTKRSTDAGRTFQDISLPCQDPDAKGPTVHSLRDHSVLTSDSLPSSLLL